MGEQDFTINHLMNDKRYFADFFNGGIFQGSQVLKEEELERIPDKSGILYIDKKGKKRTLRRYRDVIMKASFGTYFAIMACETQADVHYAMPVRTMLYDALNYVEQVQVLEEEHKKAGDQLKGSEYLSGITKEDKVLPVITVILFLGKDWDGNRSLYDMIGIHDSEEHMKLIRNYLPDYRLNLIQADCIENVEVFKTDLQYIFGVLKYNTKKTLLYQYVKDNQEALRNMDTEAMMAMWSVLGEQKRLQKLLAAGEGEERVDMCKAIDDLIADGEAKGERRLSELIMTLARQGRQDLIIKVASDEKLRTQLYEEYGI